MKFFLLFSSAILTLSLIFSLESSEFCKISQPRCEKNCPSERFKCQGNYTAQCSSTYCARNNSLCAKLKPNSDLIRRSRNPIEYLRQMKRIHTFVIDLKECPQ